MQLLSLSDLSIMGGSALGRQAPRLSREIYTEVVAELKAKLVPRFYKVVEAPRSFASKTSFGDVDLLASLPQQAFDPITDLGSTESLTNGNIKHFDYRGYQVDLIVLDESKMDLARFFYGYGDTGMIMGMFLRNLGLKFGLGGLTYKCETYKVGLSQDLKAILQFIGLDYDSWEQGYETQEGMFCYLASSKYFRPYFFSRKNPEVLELDGQKRKKGTSVFEAPTIWNHEARHRLAERPMFHNWIEHVESLPESGDKIDPEQVKAAALDFFDKEKAVQQVEEELDLGRRVKVKFNGKLAMKWTNEQLTGKPLGDLTAAFKQVYPLTRLDCMMQDDIMEAFIKFHQAQLQ